MNEEDILWRKCGICGEKIIPRGVEWPFWIAGSCVCDWCWFAENATEQEGEQIAEKLGIDVEKWAEDLKKKIDIAERRSKFRLVKR